MQYKSGTLGFDNLPNDGVIVIDVNCQGIRTLSNGVQTLFKYFPKTYAWYINNCINNSLVPGECYMHYEDEYDIAVIVVADMIVGKYKDIQLDVEMGFSQGVNSMLNKYTSTKFVSPIIGLPYSILPFVKNIITQKNLDWTIYRD